MYELLLFPTELHTTTVSLRRRCRLGARARISCAVVSIDVWSMYFKIAVIGCSSTYTEINTVIKREVRVTGALFGEQANGDRIGRLVS